MSCVFQYCWFLWCTYQVQDLQHGLCFRCGILETKRRFVHWSGKVTSLPSLLLKTPSSCKLCTDLITSCFIMDFIIFGHGAVSWLTSWDCHTHLSVSPIASFLVPTFGFGMYGTQVCRRWEWDCQCGAIWWETGTTDSASILHPRPCYLRWGYSLGILCLFASIDHGTNISSSRSAFFAFVNQ